MKHLFLILVALFMFSCTAQKSIIDPPTQETTMKPEKNKDGEWELTVLDSQYNSFLNGMARPRNMYNESTLKNKNSFLVNEWNSMYYSGRYRNVIESAIEYDRNENYGFEFEYRLYQVFAYVNWKYQIRFQNLSAGDRR